MASAVEFAVGKLGDLVVKEAINLHGVSGQVEWLERQLRQMQRFLELAAAKKNTADDENFLNWVWDMSDVALEAEDIIDTFNYFKLGRQQPGCTGFMKRYVFICAELIGRHKVHVGIEGVKAKLNELSQNRTTFCIANAGATIGTTNHSRNQDVIPILPQLSDDIAMVGFDDEKKKIVEKLVDISQKNRLVISIVGMGGLGKTTLAKSLYNHDAVNRSFDIFAWVIVSQEYSILEILKSISSKISAASKKDEIEEFSVAIFEKLRKRKYLVVLDDVWEKNVWDELRKVFPDVNNGSRVIITTRSLNVVEVEDPTIQPHELRLLNEMESQELFLHNVFPRQDIETCCPMHLVDSTHQLVQRCGGLPLALVVLGGLMSFKPKDKDEWEKVVESMKGQFVEGGERCLKVLALSYNDLPYYLKSCFLYFGCFPEDMSIPTKTLIRLWSAEGFLPTKNGKTTEEVGMDCVEELAQRCMIQLVTKRKYDDRAKYCRIHDLLRDMCISKARESRFLKIYKKGNAGCATTSNVERRLAIFNKIGTLNYSNSKLRCLFFHGAISDRMSCKALSGFKLLRVLCLTKRDHMLKSPREIKSLIHLRYLEWNSSGLKEVPSWISHLRNLQTFTVRWAHLKKISDSLWRIDSLRHVCMDSLGVDDPPNMGRNIVLKNLQTLKGVNAGEWIGNMLPKLTTLRKLSIQKFYYRDANALPRSLQKFGRNANALPSSLQKLVRLASLTIQGHEIPSDDIIRAFSNQNCLKKLSLDGLLNCKQLPHNDVFPQQLVKLELKGSELEQDPMSTLEKLPFLRYLNLMWAAYTSKQMICSATGFPQLLSLTIRWLYKLEEWRIEEKAMPCLKYLCLSDCEKLKMIPEGLKNAPLDRLELARMPEEFMARIKENTGEDWYKVQHVPNIDIK